VARRRKGGGKKEETHPGRKQIIGAASTGITLKEVLFKIGLFALKLKG
jgi:hypothetical protein